LRGDDRQSALRFAVTGNQREARARVRPAAGDACEFSQSDECAIPESARSREYRDRDLGTRRVYTLASGSSGAAAAVAHKLGRCDRAISVHMPGGIIAIEIGDEYAIRTTGAVTKVAEGVIAKEMLTTASVT
jgi:hypothetical protein